MAPANAYIILSARDSFRLRKRPREPKGYGATSRSLHRLHRESQANTEHRAGKRRTSNAQRRTNAPYFRDFRCGPRESESVRTNSDARRRRWAYGCACMTRQGRQAARPFRRDGEAPSVLPRGHSLGRCHSNLILLIFFEANMRSRGLLFFGDRFYL